MLFIFKYFYLTLVKARELDLASKNPIFKKILEITHGLQIIQLFGNQENFLKGASNVIDNSITANVFVARVIRIFTYTMEQLGWLVVAAVLIVGIIVIEEPE